MTGVRLISIPLLLGLILDLLRVGLAPLPIPSFVLHGVATERVPQDFWTLSPQSLDTFLDYLHGSGRRSLDEAGVQKALAGALPRDEAAIAVLLTIDDGHPSALTIVAPALEKRGFVGHFFVMTGARTPHLDEAEVRKLGERHVIGDHTATHRSLLPGPREAPEAYAKALESEIPGSKKALETTLGRPVTAFAYPRGESDPHVEETVRRAGFTLAYTTEPGYLEPGTSPLAIPRYQLSHDTPIAWIQDHVESPERQRDQRLMLEGALALILALYLLVPDRSKCLH